MADILSEIERASQREGETNKTSKYKIRTKTTIVNVFKMKLRNCNENV